MLENYSLDTIKKNRATGTVAAFSTLIWIVLLLLGIDLYSGVAERGIAGFPNAAQFRLSVILPAVMIALNACLVTLVNKIPKGVYIAVSGVQFVLMPIFLMLCAGGV